MHATNKAAYNARRESMLKKLHAKKPASDRPKFTVGDDGVQVLPEGLTALVGDVLKLTYVNGMSVYPENNFKVIDALWCAPGPEIAFDAVGVRDVTWGRTRFFIEYKRAYGKFKVDFLTHEPLPKDFTEQDNLQNEAACTLDVSNRKIAMQNVRSVNCNAGAATGNARSNFFDGIVLGAKGWVNVDQFAEQAEIFRKRHDSMHVPVPGGLAGTDSITQPLPINRVNFGENITDVVLAAQYKPLGRCIVIFPTDGKPIRGKCSAQK